MIGSATANIATKCEDRSSEVCMTKTCYCVQEVGLLGITGAPDTAAVGTLTPRTPSIVPTPRTQGNPYAPDPTQSGHAISNSTESSASMLDSSSKAAEKNTGKMNTAVILAGVVAVVLVCMVTMCVFLFVERRRRRSTEAKKAQVHTFPVYYTQ